MTLRRGGRVVECTALEMRHTREGIVGSNPTLSAIALRRNCALGEAGKSRNIKGFPKLAPHCACQETADSLSES